MWSRQLCADGNPHAITFTDPNHDHADTRSHTITVAVPEPVSDLLADAVAFDHANTAPELSTYTSSVISPNPAADVTAFANTDEFADDH